MSRNSINPNTPELWDRLLFQKNHELLRSNFYRDKIKKVASFLDSKGGRFLDIGFGMGNLEEILQKSKSNINEFYGIEMSPKALSRAKRLFEGEFYLSNAITLPFKSLYFDSVAILDVLEHLEERNSRKVLKETWRVLKPGGYLVVSVPLNEKLKMLVTSGLNENAHMREYTITKLMEDIKRLGFQIVNKELLYAFKNYYALKTLVVKFLNNFRKPNLVIIYAIKK